MAEFNEENIQNNDDFLNIQELLIMCLSKWKWFALSLVLALCCAVLYVLRTPPVYTRSASILIKEEGKGSGSLAGELSSFADMGMFSSGINVYNELITIQSPALMWEVVKRLRLDVRYSEEGTFHDNTLYGESLPVRVNFLDPDTRGSFEINVNADGNASLTAFILEGEKVQGNVKGNVGRVRRCLERGGGQCESKPNISLRGRHRLLQCILGISEQQERHRHRHEL